MMRISSEVWRYWTAGVPADPWNGAACRFAKGTLWAHPGIGLVLGMGRVVAASVEIWAITQYMKHLVQNDCVAAAAAQDQ